MRIKPGNLWPYVLGMTLVQVFLVLEVSTDRGIYGDKVEDALGLILPGWLFGVFLVLALAGLAVGGLGGLLGGLLFKEKSLSRPCWFAFVFNILNFLCLFIAVAAAAGA